MEERILLKKLECFGVKLILLLLDELKKNLYILEILIGLIFESYCVYLFYFGVFVFFDVNIFFKLL